MRRQWGRGSKNDNTIQDIAEMLLSAEKPVLLCGYGVKDSEPIQQLAEMLDVPVATTYLHIMMFIQSIINIPCVFGLRLYGDIRSCVSSVEEVKVKVKDTIRVA